MLLVSAGFLEAADEAGRVLAGNVRIFAGRFDIAAPPGHKRCAQLTPPALCHMYTIKEVTRTIVSADILAVRAHPRSSAPKGSGRSRKGQWQGRGKAVKGQGKGSGRSRTRQRKVEERQRKEKAVEGRGKAPAIAGEVDHRGPKVASGLTYDMTALSICWHPGGHSPSLFKHLLKRGGACICMIESQCVGGMLLVQWCYNHVLNCLRGGAAGRRVGIGWPCPCSSARVPPSRSYNERQWEVRGRRWKVEGKGSGKVKEMQRKGQGKGSGKVKEK